MSGWVEVRLAGTFPHGVLIVMHHAHSRGRRQGNAQDRESSR